MPEQQTVCEMPGRDYAAVVPTKAVIIHVMSSARQVHLRIRPRVARLFSVAIGHVTHLRAKRFQPADADGASQDRRATLRT